MATTARGARRGRCMLPVGLAVGHSRSGSGSRSQSQMLARSQSQALTCRCCRPCARVRSCVIPGAYPAAPWWRSQARRGPCPPTPMTVQATRTQEHDDAPFRCNTLGRALLAILRPRPRPPPRTAHRTGTAARETQGPSRSYPVLSTELEREVEDSAGLRDLEGQLPHSSRRGHKQAPRASGLAVGRARWLRVTGARPGRLS